MVKSLDELISDINDISSPDFSNMSLEDKCHLLFNSNQSKMYILYLSCFYDLKSDTLCFVKDVYDAIRVKKHSGEQNILMILLDLYETLDCIRVKSQSMDCLVYEFLDEELQHSFRDIKTMIKDLTIEVDDDISKYKSKEDVYNTYMNKIREEVEKYDRHS